MKIKYFTKLQLVLSLYNWAPLTYSADYIQSDTDCIYIYIYIIIYSYAIISIEEITRQKRNFIIMEKDTY